MKLLLDENLPQELRNDFSSEEGFEAFNIRDMRWLGKENGELLRLIESNRFEAFITGDKNLEYQQSAVPIAVIVLEIHPLIYEALKPIVPIVPKVTKVTNFLRTNPAKGVYRISG